MNIDELIEKSKSMPNISDGGSKAYSFGDYVLVRYDGHNKYGIARDMEEQVMVAVNNKNGKFIKGFIKAEKENDSYDYIAVSANNRAIDVVMYYKKELKELVLLSLMLRTQLNN